MRHKNKIKRHFRKLLMLVVVLILGTGIYLNCFAKTNNKVEDEFRVLEVNKKVDTNQISSEAQALLQATEKPTEAPKKEMEKVEKVEQEKSGKVVYLTFDDGPYKSTPELLDVLDKYNVKATFFVTAQFLTGQKLIDSLKEIDRRGHVVAVHTFSHRYNEIYSSVDSYLEDYEKMADIIFEATGKRNNIFRFPGGSNAGYSSHIREDLLSAVKSKGLVYYDWNAYDGDCDGFTGEKLIEKAVTESSYKDKSILLMHDIPGKEAVIDALPSIIEQLQKKGYEFRTLSKLVKPIQFESID
ncbi:MAG: polysaccharide deacetylase family protein [bacterium]|nr:polysaccharide deacetylase family protein [bacterium]